MKKLYSTLWQYVIALAAAVVVLGGVSWAHHVHATAAPATTGETLEAMNNDSRVKLGAYRIEGIDTVITLGSGQTMERYCRTQGGGSGFLVYYQVVNGVDSLGEGAKMKVPKLSLKKRK